MQIKRQAVTRPQDLSDDYRRYLAAVVLFHLAAADEVGLGSTDYQASSILDLDGPMTSGELAGRLALSSGATTRVIDRMIATGYVRRVEDPSDRRRVMVENTQQRPPRLEEVLATVRRPVGDVIDGLSPEQLEGVAIYLRGSAEAYREAARQLRSA